MVKKIDNKVPTLEDKTSENVEQKPQKNTKKNKSVFENVMKVDDKGSPNDPIEDTTLPEADSDDIKEPNEDLDSDTEQDAPINIKEPDPSPSLVFEITYLDPSNETKSEGLAYTFIPPILSKDGAVRITEAFGRLNLEENILDKTIVKESCKKNLEVNNFLVDAGNGVLIKAMEQQEWMQRDMLETKKMFDEKVLVTFREVQEGIKEEIKKNEKVVPIENTPRRHVDDADPSLLEKPGNIPISKNRPILKDW